MEASIYTKAKNNIGTGKINLIENKISVLLIDTTLYTVDLENDASLFDVSELAIIAEKTLDGITFIDGVFDANDAFFDVITENKTFGAVVLAIQADTLESSLLISYSNDATNLPILTTGESITISWSNESTKILKL